jgi:gluconate 2-dehydrogenase subunit 3-like protein
MESRRTALIRIATVTASAAMAPLLSSEPPHHMEAAAQEPLISRTPSYFQEKDYQTISRVVDLIIPRTDTPGALDAHVPFRIDQQVGATPKLQEQFRQGLEYLSTEAQKRGNTDFLSLSEDQQIKILQDMSVNGEFFTTAKNLTIEWYYRSEQGLVQELGFKGNTFRPSFPGCIHPEHWPAKEKA